MKVEAEVNLQTLCLHVYVDGEFIKECNISKSPEPYFYKGYFKYNKERYDFILDFITVHNKIDILMYIYPLYIGYEYNPVKVSITGTLDDYKQNFNNT